MIKGRPSEETAFVLWRKENGEGKTENCHQFES